MTEPLIPLVFPAALIMGPAGAELLRRSGSIWSAVVVHDVVNLLTIPVMVLADMG